MNKFEEKRIEMTVVSEIYGYIERQRDGEYTHYAPTEELVQASEWNTETRKYEPAWEDEEHTIPKMEKKWADIPYTEEELKDMPEVQVKIDTYNNLMKMLEKLI